MLKKIQKNTKARTFKAEMNKKRRFLNTFLHPPCANGRPFAQVVSNHGYTQIFADFFLGTKNQKKNLTRINTVISVTDLHRPTLFFWTGLTGFF